MSPCTVVSQALLQAQAVKEHTLKQKQLQQLTMTGRDAKVDMYPNHHLPIITYFIIHHLPTSSPTYHHLTTSSPNYLIT